MMPSKAERPINNLLSSETRQAITRHLHTILWSIDKFDSSCCDGYSPHVLQSLIFGELQHVITLLGENVYAANHDAARGRNEDCK